MAQRRTTKEWQQADSAHFMHPFTDFKLAGQEGLAHHHAKPTGIYLWDNDGHKILDAMSGLWCVNVGYGQQALIDAATRQLKELPFYNAFFQTATPPSIELAELLAEVTPGRTSSTPSSPARAPRATTPWCAWCGATGTSWASLSGR